MCRLKYNSACQRWPDDDDEVRPSRGERRSHRQRPRRSHRQLFRNCRKGALLTNDALGAQAAVATSSIQFQELLRREASGSPVIKEHAMSKLNIVSIIVIVVVIIGGAAALYRFDDGQGSRTSPDIAAKVVSD